MFESRHAVFASASFGEMTPPARETPKTVPEKQIPLWRERLAALDLTPDLAEDIGSLRWFRGLATFTLLSVAACAFIPHFGPVYGAQSPLPNLAEQEEARAQMIMPLALGADSGRHMAANDHVVALGSSPERPTIELTASLGRGDSFMRVLERAGVGSGDAAKVQSMVANITDLSAVDPGTLIDIRLGRRISNSMARPLDHLSFRARFDLNLAINRNGGALQLSRDVIAVDNTPLRIHGIVGDSLYRSARAAGAPADAIQSFLKVIASHASLSAIQPDDEYDIILDYRRAATGEVQSGNLLYAGIDRGGAPKIQLLKFGGSGGDSDASGWYEASGVGQSRGRFTMPVNGHVTSGFGMRLHPILGYVRMHSGMDFGAPIGSPIFATADGTVTYAAHKGGYGNFVQVNHGGGMASGYGHMSRIAAYPGEHVRQGQVLGYVGNSGLSTGPHLHYEVYRDGHVINPATVQFIQRAQLSGADLARFRARLAQLKSVKAGAALAPMHAARLKTIAPMREIDRVKS